MADGDLGLEGKERLIWRGGIVEEIKLESCFISITGASLKMTQMLLP